VVKELIKRKFPMLSLALKAQCGCESIKRAQSNMFDHTEPKTKEEEKCVSESETQANVSSLLCPINISRHKNENP
jgi:hypothetical protein